jgi:hypothetical protein
MVSQPRRTHSEHHHETSKLIEEYVRLTAVLQCYVINNLVSMYSFCAHTVAQVGNVIKNKITIQYLNW